MGEVLIKVYIEKIKQTKQFGVSQEMRVMDVIAHMRDKMLNVDIGGPSYHLYAASRVPGAPGQFLLPEVPIQKYIAHLNGTLEFRSVERTLRVRFMDNTSKVMTIDARDQVSAITADIGIRYGLTDTSEFGLVLDVQSNGLQATDKKEELKAQRTRSILGLNLGRSSSSLNNDRAVPPIFNQEERKNRKPQQLVGTRNREEFLDPVKTLEQLGIDNSAVLIFKKQFYFSDHVIDTSAPHALKAIFWQAAYDIANGRYCAPLEPLCDLAALFLQATIGNFMDSVFKAFDVTCLLSPDSVADSKAEKRATALVREKWEALKSRNLSENAAMYEYMLATREIRDYGTTYFIALEPRPKGTDPVPVAVGVSRDKITIADNKSRTIKAQFPLKWLKKDMVQGPAITFDFGDHAKHTFTFLSKFARDIAVCIRRYLKFHVEKRQRRANQPSDGDAGGAADADDDDVFEYDVMEAAEAQSFSVQSFAAPVGRIETVDPMQISPSLSGLSLQQTPTQQITSTLQVTLRLAAPDAMAHLKQEIEVGSIDLSLMDSLDDSQAASATLGREDWRAQTTTLSRQSLREQASAIASAFVGLANGLFAASTGAVFDANDAALHVRHICETMTELTSTVQLLSSLGAADWSADVIGQCRGLAAATAVALNNLPDASDVVFNESTFLLTLDNVARALTAILVGTRAGAVDQADFEDVLEQAHRVETGVPDMLYRVLDQIIPLVTDRVDAMKLRESITHLHASMLLLVMGTRLMAPVMHTHDARDQVRVLIEQFSERLVLCRGTAARNLEEHAALKTQLQLQVTSAEDVADRLLRQAMAVHAVHPSTSQDNVAAAAVQEREEHPLVAVGRLAGKIYDLVDPAIPASSHDPTVPMQCMKQLSAALNKVHTQATEMQANALIMAVLRDVQKIVTLLSTSISHYALTVLRMDSAAEAETAAMAGQIRSVCGQVSGQVAQLQQLLNES